MLTISRDLLRNAVEYDYLTTGEVSAVREPGGLTLAAYAYDDLGRRRRLVRGNGVVTSYTPDAASRLASQVDDLAGGTRDQSVGLAYNGVSQLTTRESSNDAYTYRGYRPTSQAVVPDALNRIATLNAANVAYDANGNLVSDARGSGYGYNLDNQLVAKSGVATLAYDPVGRLQTVSPAAAPATRFEHDPLSGMILAEGAAAPARRYVPGPGVDEPLVWYEGTEHRWYSADERGSITAVTDAGGTALAINAYDENGVPDPRNLGRFGYTGQAWLGEIGLAYYKARIYAPDLARFLQTDPIGYDGGINLYAYVRGDPVNFSDPFGLGTQFCADGTVAADNRIESCDSHGGPGDIVTSGGKVGGASVGFGGTNGGNGSGGGAPAAGQRTQTPTPCQRAFLKGQLASRGLPTSQIDRLKFVSGLDGNANAATRSAFPNAAAVTQGATVYVQPSRFNEVANFRSPVGFEEAYHTGQFALWGAGTFYDSYGVMSMGGVLFGLGSRDGNLIEQFAEGASRVMYNNYQGAGCPR